MSQPFQAQPIGNKISKWGEGPIWHQSHLYYVDIESHQVIRLDPATGEEMLWQANQRVGTVVPAKDGRLLIAGDRGFSFLDPETGEFTAITDPESHLPNTRFNDGKCDSQGRFWAGTIDLNSPRQPVAALYCLETDLSVSQKLSEVTNSNGIVWSLDDRIMYYIDTPKRLVQAFDFDAASGTISNGRVAFDTSMHSGNPDGMTIDSDGNLWIAFCHGSAVRCFNPSNGELLAEITLPFSSVTAVAFGGKDLEDLYITTGQNDIENSGRVFVAKTTSRGIPSCAFGV